MENPGQAAEAAIGEFFAALGARWLLTTQQCERLGPAVRSAIEAGWSPGGLAAFAGANAEGARSPYAVLRSRLSVGELPGPPSPARSRPPWCGICDETSRMLDYHGDAPRPCPRCKRSAPTVAAGGRVGGSR